MSGRVVGRVFERIVGSAPRKAVLLCLAEHSNPDGEMAYPSVWRIGKETELAESTVRSALAWLRKQRLIIQTYPAAQHRPPTYRVNLDRLSDLPLVEVYRKEHQVSDLPLVALRPPAPGPEPSLNRPLEGARPKTGRAVRPDAVELFRRIMHRYPNKTAWQRIDRAIGSDFPALLHWGRVLRQWVLAGHNPTNILDMLDVFKKGWRPAGGNGRPGNARQGYDPVADMAAFKDKRGLK